MTAPESRLKGAGGRAGGRAEPAGAGEPAEIVWASTPSSAAEASASRPTEVVSAKAEASASMPSAGGASDRWVQAAGVTHRFPGTQQLFPPLDFRLLPGEVIGVCGPSGCGKSTLLSILAGWVTPEQGRLTLHGIEHIGWVFQNPQGLPARTALDHVVFPLLARGSSRAEAEDEALAIMALFRIDQLAARRFGDISGGEAQRLMLARAVATGSDLLLVDEPTAQLDLATAATVNRTLANLAAGGSIVVIATHDPQTRASCTRVLDLAARVAS